MKIVGLEKLREVMFQIAKNFNVYKKGMAPVPNLVMNLTRNNGQSFVADYIASVLYENKLRDFCGLDTLLEYKVDGSLKQMKRIFEDISSNAVYTNEYKGVVAIDVTALSGFTDESQVDYFMEHIKMVALNATVIIFYDDSLGKRMTVVKEKIIEAVGNCVDISLSPYSQKDYTEIILENLEGRGIEIDECDDFENALCRIVDERLISTAKQAVGIVDELMFCVDYSGLRPKISLEIIKKTFINENTLTLGRLDYEK